MSRMRRGFTLIEIALFLAVTGALFVGIMVGTQNSIWQQRYNDTVQNFANFLRNVYSEVSNPQSLGGGRSDQAIYGKLISFGQTYGLDGELLAEDDQRVFVYDVVGDATGAGTGSVTSTLASLKANVVIFKKDGERVEEVVPAGIVESYSPIWGSVIEEIKKPTDGDDSLYKGSILIVRHPRSGTVNTLISDGVIEINKEIADTNLFLSTSVVESTEGLEINNMLTKKLSGFDLNTANFCVNPYGRGETGTMRRDIRIVRNARNASGVEIVNLDSEDNLCL